MANPKTKKKALAVHAIADEDMAAMIDEMIADAEQAEVVRGEAEKIDGWWSPGHLEDRDDVTTAKLGPPVRCVLLKRVTYTKQGKKPRTMWLARLTRATILESEDRAFKAHEGSVCAFFEKAALHCLQEREGEEVLLLPKECKTLPDGNTFWDIDVRAFGMADKAAAKRASVERARLDRAAADEIPF